MHSIWRKQANTAPLDKVSDQTYKHSLQTVILLSMIFKATLHKDRLTAQHVICTPSFPCSAQLTVTPLQTALKIIGFALEGVMLILCLLRKKLREKLPENAYRYTVLGLLFAGSWLISQDFISAMGIMLIRLLFLAFRSGDRKTIFCERSSDYFLSAVCCGSRAISIWILTDTGICIMQPQRV